MKMKRHQARLGLYGFEDVDSVGNNGGLSSFWHESIIVDVVSLSRRYIDAHVKKGTDDPQWSVYMGSREWRIDTLCGPLCRI